MHTRIYTVFLPELAPSLNSPQKLYVSFDVSVFEGFTYILMFEWVLAICCCVIWNGYWHGRKNDLVLLSLLIWSQRALIGPMRIFFFCFYANVVFRCPIYVQNGVLVGDWCHLKSWSDSGSSIVGEGGVWVECGIVVEWLGTADCLAILEG